MRTPHTRLPWKDLEYSESGNFAIGRNAGTVTVLIPRKRDVAFVLRAVNAHDPLVEALADAESWLPFNAEALPLRNRIKAALQLARGVA